MPGLPWFKVASDFPSHPKTLRLCALLGDHNAGMYVVRLLAYCAIYAPDGRVPLDMMKQAAGWSKQRARLELLVSSLETAGFIVCTPTHAEIHGWDEWNGAHIRKAAKDNARPRSDYRLPRAGTSRGGGGNLAGPALESREREEKTEKKQLPSDALRAPVADDVLRLAEEFATDVTHPPTSLFPQSPARAAAETTAPKPKRPPTAKSEASPAAREKRATWERLFEDSRGESYRWGGPADQTAANALASVDLAIFEAKAKRGLVGAGFGRCSSLAQLKAKWNDLSGVVPGSAGKPRVISNIGNHTSEDF